jgi:hypothetical protein
MGYGMVALRLLLQALAGQPWSASLAFLSM